MKGYYVGGKTGTAEKVDQRPLFQDQVLTDFMAILPSDNPRYLALVMLDEPQPLPETHGFATVGLECRAGHGARSLPGSHRCSVSSLVSICHRPTSSFFTERRIQSRGRNR